MRARLQLMSLSLFSHAARVAAQSEVSIRSADTVSCSAVAESDRLECGHFGNSRDSCDETNCCWAESGNNEAWCFQKLVRISTGSPYENNQNWTVTYSCQEDETAEFRLTELKIEFDFDNLFIDFGDTTLVFTGEAQDNADFFNWTSTKNPKFDVRFESDHSQTANGAEILARCRASERAKSKITNNTSPFRWFQKL